MIKFYFNGSPNPTKIALALEEMGLVYEAIPVDPRRGEQFNPDYLAINPNAKVPSIVDDGVTVFDSNAILLYLAEKAGRFLPPASAANRAELLSWLMFVATGVGPFGGQAVHFRHFAPECKTLPRRDRGTASRPESRHPQGPPSFQGGDRRGDAPQHVPPPGRLKS